MPVAAPLRRAAAALRASATTKRAFVRALERLAADVSVRDLRDIIEAGGDVYGIFDDLPRDLAPMGEYVESVLHDATQREVERMLTGGIDIAWEHVERRAVSEAMRRSSRLIVEITAQQRDAIRVILANATAHGWHPSVTAESIKQVVGLNSRLARAVANRRAQMLADGLDPREIRARTDAYAARLLTYRANMIARTEQLWSNNMGRTLAWQAARDEGLLGQDAVRRWSTSKRENMCPICRPMDGEVAPLDGTWTLPNGRVVRVPTESHPHCVTGDTLISAPGTLATARREFQGALYRIQTARGYRLAVTPNHPVLTPRGWVPARLLDVGGDVISQRLGDRGVRLREVDDQDVPARAEDVVESSRRAREMASVPVPVAPEHFHGDGRGSEVAIVTADRLLWDRLDAARAQESAETALVLGLAAEALDARGDGEAMGLTLATPAHGVVRGGDARGALCRRHAAIHHEARLARRASLDAGLGESPLDDVTRDAEVTRDLQFGAAGEVIADHVTHIEIDPVWRGHVYNLHSTRGWYASNGIISHNCACVAVLDVPGSPASEFVRRRRGRR